MATDTNELESFVDPDLLETAYNNLVSRLPEIPIDNSQATETLYNIIKADRNVAIFSRLLEQHSRLVSLLQDPSSGEHTIFLPIDFAWQDDPQRVAEDALSIHISPHYLTTDGFLHMPNVPTMFTPAQANGPQIVRTRFGPGGWEVNQTTSIVKGNIIARNGVIHYIDRVLVSPPDALHMLQHADELSKLSKAIQIAGVGADFADPNIRGRTLFAPTNAAFNSLGSDIVHFLFEDEYGRPYLKTLLQLHFSPNVTFFSNFIWPKNNTGARQTSTDAPRRIKGKQTQSIHTRVLSGGAAAISVTLGRFNGLIALLINRSAKVIVQDLATSDGVVHVLDRVLLPDSLKYGGDHGTTPSLAAFKESLADYMYADDVHEF